MRQVQRVCAAAVLLLAALASLAHAKAPISLADATLQYDRIVAPCGGAGEKCCANRVCSVGGVSCQLRGVGYCLACGNPGVVPCPGNTPCVGARAYVRQPGTTKAKCALCPDTEFWTYNAGPPAVCTPNCGQVGLVPCARCAKSVVNRYLDINGLCASCNTASNNYAPTAGTSPATCTPCGTDAMVPCTIGGCSALANPYVDPATGFCASCDLSTSDYAGGVCTLRTVCSGSEVRIIGGACTSEVGPQIAVGALEVGVTKVYPRRPWAATEILPAPIDTTITECSTPSGSKVGVAFSFTPDASGSLYASTDGFSGGQDTYLYVTSDESVLAEDDDSGGSFSSTLTVSVNAGQEYTVWLSLFSSSACFPPTSGLALRFY